MDEMSEAAADCAASEEHSANQLDCGREAGTPSSHECDSSSSEAETLGIPYIRNTFLNSALPLRSRRRAVARSRSADVPGTCDRYEAEVHALMFKVNPVPRTCSARTPSAPSAPNSPSSPRLSRSPAELSASVFASAVREKSRAVEETSGTEGGETRSVYSEASFVTADVLTESGTAEEEDTGISEAEEGQEPEHEKVSEDEPIESVLARIPYDELGRPTSIGSLSHALGECRPCAFLGSEQRPCQNGARCPFCHLPHPAKRRIRLCRRKRLEMRASVAAAVAEAGSDGIRPPPRYLPISWPARIATAALHSAGFS